jgi:hypothetical protein
MVLEYGMKDWKSWKETSHQTIIFLTQIRDQPQERND